MCVIVQRHGDVGRGFFRLVLLVVLLDKPSQHTFVTGLLFGITVAVKKQEILVAVDIDRRVEGRFQEPFPVVDGLVGVTLLGAPLDILPVAVRFA